MSAEPHADPSSATPRDDADDPDPQNLPPARADEILDAARAIFARRGFSGTTIQEVADAAGIAKGTVYLYYRSKEELYWAAMRRGLGELHRRSAAAMQQAADTAGKLRAFLATRLTYFEENRDFFSIYFTELGNTLVRPVPGGEMEALYLGQVEALRGVLRAGMERGELRPLRDRATAFAILDLVKGRVAQRLRGWSTVSPEEDLEQLDDLVWRAIVR